jgi:Asp-tRNA(Asn)/Glu-tRNA(Gln) amidotransferase A subunit family amidase
LTKRNKPARLAVLETGGWKATSEGARKAFAAVKDKLAKAGVELKSRADDADIEAVERTIADAQPLSLAINAWEGRWPLNTYADLDASKLSENARERLKGAEAMTQKEFAGLLDRRVAARTAFAKAAGKYDAFVTLGACGAAPVGLSTTGNTAMNVAASLLGCPALTVPLLEDEGMPLGLQFLGAMDRDAALFELAGWVAADVFNRADLVGAAG